MWRSMRCCLSVYFDLSPRGMLPPRNGCRVNVQLVFRITYLTTVRSSRAHDTRAARHLHTRECQLRRMRRWNGMRTISPAAAAPAGWVLLGRREVTEVAAVQAVRAAQERREHRRPERAAPVSAPRRARAPGRPASVAVRAISQEPPRTSSPTPAP